MHVHVCHASMAGIPVLQTCSVGMTVRDILPAGKTLEMYGPVYVVDTGCMPGSIG